MRKQLPSSSLSVSVEDIDLALQRWVEAGLLESEQRDAIVCFERSEDGQIEAAGRQPSVVPVVVEVLGYVAVVIVAAAGGLAISQFWQDLETWSRLLMVGVVTGLVAIGAAWISSSEDAAITRLANFLWFVGTAGVATWIAILGATALDLQAETVGLITGMGAGAVAAALLWWRRGTLQVLALFGALVAVILSALSFPDYVEPWAFGLAIWALGAGWGLLSWAGILPHPRAGYALASVAALGGAITVASASEAPGIWLGILTSAFMLAAAVRLRSGVLLGLGVPGLLIFTGWTIAYYVGASGGEGQGNLTVTLVILVLGLGLLAGVLVAARGRGAPPAAPSPVGGHRVSD